MVNLKEVLNQNRNGRRRRKCEEEYSANLVVEGDFEKKVE